jgi:Tfp pilus assembly protein PilN
MDFLPRSHRIGDERRRARQWSFLLGAVVVCGLVATEGVLRYRLQGLRATRRYASEQAESATLRTAQIDELQLRHQELIDELDEWAGPLETQRATQILDSILVSRPGSVHLELVDWKSDPINETGPPTLRIGGVLQDLGDLVEFLTAMERNGGLPRLEVRRSGISGVPTAHSLQTFVVESVAGGRAQG